MKAAWLIVALTLQACATSSLALTADSLDVTAQTFDATATEIERLNAAGKLTQKQHDDWNVVLPSFQFSYRMACRLWTNAREAQNADLEAAAAAVLGTFAAQLAPFVEIVSSFTTPAPPAPAQGVPSS